MISLLVKIAIVSFFILAINSQPRIDNPEKEFKNYLDLTDDKIRDIADIYQKFERKYRRHCRRTVKLINSSIANITKELEIPLKIIFLNYTKSLEKKSFKMNDSEDIAPKKVCTKANESTKEYENMMMTFLAKNGNLKINLTSLAVEVKKVNSSNFNVSEVQSNFTSNLLIQLNNLINATQNFTIASNEAAFNVSNILITLKTRVMNYCGSFNGMTTTKRKTKKTTTRRTPAPKNVTISTKFPWGFNVRPIDNKVNKKI